MNAMRFIKSEVRSRMMELSQAPISRRATEALRRVRLWHWYGEQRLTLNLMNRWIEARIAEALPTAIGKLGEDEIELLDHDDRRTLLGRRVPLPKMLRERAYCQVGFFPATDIGLWSALDAVRAAVSTMDGMAVLGEPSERRLIRKQAKDLRVICAPAALEPFNSASPWTHALADKRVLVVHPFAATIRRQYEVSREAMWRRRPGLLPEFELTTLPMPVAAGLAPPAERTWLERLQRLREHMAGRTFDVALVGAGGMSLPLVAHAKDLGAVGVHLGASTQLLFGIRGRRWDMRPDYAALFNEAWVRPSSAETPASAGRVDDGCYW